MAAAMTSLSRTEPPGWMAQVAPASAAAMRPSGNGKKASLATTLPARERPASSAFQMAMREASTRDIWPGADAEGAVLGGIDDGVGLHVLDHAPAEEHRLHFVGGGRALGDDFFLEALELRGRAGVAILHEHAAEHGADVELVFLLAGRRGELAHEAQVFLFLEEDAGVGLEFRGDDDLAENLADGAGERLGEGAVADDDAAEGGLLVGGEGLVPRGLQVGIGADAAGVGVLEDGDGRLGKFLDELGGGGDIEDVVEGEFLAVELLEVLVEIAVERGLLVRVLAVAEAGGDGQGEGERAGGLLFAC